MEKREEEEERIDDGEETDEEKKRGGWAHEAFGGVSLSLSLSLSLSFSLFLDVWGRVLVVRLCFFFSFEKLCARALDCTSLFCLCVCVCVCVCVCDITVCVYNNIYNNRN